MNSINKILKQTVLFYNKFGIFLTTVFFVLFIAIKIASNGSFIFEEEFITNYGDQTLYFELARGLYNLTLIKSQFTLGYPFVFLPLIAMYNNTHRWQDVMPALIFIQALVVVPFSLVMILRNKKHLTRLTTTIALILYFLFLNTSEDQLVGLNLLGLIPLSEPVVTILLICTYWIYISFVKNKRYSSLPIFFLGLCISASVMTRQTSVILITPVFIDLLFSKEYKKLLILSLISFALFSPQLFYNYKVGGSPTFNGYTWWAETREEENNIMKQALYGFSTEAIFSARYFVHNLTQLATRYSILLLAIVPLASMVRKDRLATLILFATIANLVFHLSYWWSAADGLIDRFLLPNFLLLLFYWGESLNNHTYENSYNR